ncbi:hypothetical protein RKD18_008023 [Streptomyces phaeoluteigriseus]
MAFVRSLVREVSFLGDQPRPVEVRGVLLRCPARVAAFRGSVIIAGSGAGGAVDREAALAAEFGEGLTAGVPVGVCPLEPLCTLLGGVGGLGLVAEITVRAAHEAVPLGDESLLDGADVVVGLAELDIGQDDDRHLVSRRAGGSGRGRPGPRAAPDHHPEGRGAFRERQSGCHGGRGDSLVPLEHQQPVTGERQILLFHQGIGLRQGGAVARKVDGAQSHPVLVAEAQPWQRARPHLGRDLQRQCRHRLVADLDRLIGGPVRLDRSLIDVQYQARAGRGQ